MMYQSNEASTLQRNFSKCSRCGGGGFIVVDKCTPDSEELYGVGKAISYAVACPDCNGGHEQKVERARERANIPSSHYNAKLEAFNWDIYKNSKTDGHKKAVESFITRYRDWRKQGQGLYIYSKMRGTGKTFLASCICNELITREAITPKFVSEAELIAIAKSANNDALDEYERDPIKLLCKCELLVIDDLGQSKTGGEWLNNILFRIIDNRYEEKLVTIITSNIELSCLDVDVRLTDRINAMTIPLHLPEYAVRLEEAKQGKRAFLEDMGLIEKGA